MEGLNTSISIKGEKGREILEKIHLQMKEWKLTLPDIDPLILDFGLGDFADIGETEFWIANEVQGGYCGKFMFLFEGQTCPKHFHTQKLETFYIKKGCVKMEYEEEEIVMKQGDVLLINLEKYHRFTALETALILEVSSPCIGDDNFFENKRIPYGKNHQLEN
ncbi:MAG: D-lyxose/D-mannose family sugar isomerase [Bacteroidetes bacterium]|nr:D-lyxose/D-mannose family sugar isomerase [Bacteroidota bacterium]